MQLIRPNWSTHPRVQAAMTTRLGGVSGAPYDSLNLGYGTADDRASVMQNEGLVAQVLDINETDIRWLHQVHGNIVHHAESLPENAPLGATHTKGDAVVSHRAGLVCAVKAADCMPVLFAARDGTSVAAAHAGWRGLSGGVLERTVAEMGLSPPHIRAWMGPCIGPTAFEVGEEVRAAFVAHDAAAALHFAPLESANKFLCNLYGLAKQRLNAMGVVDVSGGDYCTYTQADLFFSHRRQPLTGRMAALVWISRD